MKHARTAVTAKDIPFFEALEVQLAGRGVMSLNKGDHLLVTMFQDSDALKALQQLGWILRKDNPDGFTGYYACREDGTYPLTVLNGRGAWSISAPL